MFLGYQENKIKYYVEQPLDPSIYNVDKWEETNDEYALDDDEYVLKDEKWEEKVKAKEQDRVNRLTMTPLDLIKAVKTLGISDEDIETFLNNNLAIKHELQFCQNVYCGIVKQFLPIEISEGIMLTEELVEHLFKVKNGEES